jgi:Flp pilus assembly CpaE family ATPase
LRDFLTRRESLLTPYLPKEEKPAEEQEGAKPQGKVIALSSGRGGVGKTTLLVNLAIAIAQETRQPVAVLDLFIGDSLILVNATARMTLSEIPEAVREIDLPLLQSFATCHESGVHFFTWFFSPERNLPEYIDIDRLSDVLRVLREGYAYILMETPVTLYVPDLELLKLADEVIIVAVPWDLVSVRATKALTLGMQRWGVTPKLLLNRVERNSELTPEFVAEQLQLPIWEKIPNNSRLVVRANNTGIPIMLANPDSDIADAIRRAARRLAGLPVEETRRRFGFF